MNVSSNLKLICSLVSLITIMGFEIGKKSAEVLFERINNNSEVNSPQVIYIEGKLSIGGST